jgi:hypothetical protein
MVKMSTLEDGTKGTVSIKINGCDFLQMLYMMTRPPVTTQQTKGYTIAIHDIKNLRLFKLQC